MCAAERGGGFGATAYASGVIAAAIAAITGFSAARFGRSREVSSATSGRGKKYVDIKKGRLGHRCGKTRFGVPT